MATITKLVLPAAAGVDYGGGNIDHIANGEDVDDVIAGRPHKNIAYRDTLLNDKQDEIVDEINAAFRNAGETTGAARTVGNVDAYDLSVITNNVCRLRVKSDGSFAFANGDPVATAQVQIDSTTKGFLPPRMTTTQRNAIVTPAEGLVVYDSTLHALFLRDNSAWVELSIGSALNVEQEIILITAGHEAAGQFALVHTPSDPKVVQITPVGGMEQVNAAVNPGGTTADYESSGLNIKINANSMPGETLTADIKEADVVIVNYVW